MSAVNKTQLRLATKADVGILYAWVNQKDSLQNKLETSYKISWRNHNRWFNTVRNSVQVELYIIRVNHCAIGQIRLQIKNKVALIDIYIEESYRRYGIAKQKIQQITSQHRSCVHRYVAIIKRHNKKSMALFKSSGFKLDKQTRAYYQMYRPAV